MRSYLPVIYDNRGELYRHAIAESNLYNCVPTILADGEIGSAPRAEFGTQSNAPSDAADRGRGVTAFAGIDELYLDQTSYYYSGGNTDLTATSSPGYAGNTGFNEEYLGSFVEHKVSGVTNLVIVNPGHSSTHASAKHGCVWYAANGASAPASISDADMPGNNGVSLVRGGASLDGYLFLGDINGQIHNSNLNDITAWTATDFLTASRDNGIGVYIGRHHNDVVSISTKGIEFFYNAGNASGSPLARRTDVYHSVGCFTPNTIIEVGDVIYFHGTNRDGRAGVYRLQNYQLEIISNAFVETMTNVLAGVNPDVTALDSLIDYMWMVRITTSNTPGLLLTYNNSASHYWHEKTGQWSRWACGIAAIDYRGGTTTADWSFILPIVSHNQIDGEGLSYYQLTNGRVIDVNASGTDAINDWSSANAPDAFMQFPRWDAGTDKKKRVNWTRVITAPVSSTGTMNVDLRWFDYTREQTSGPIPPDTNYSTARTVNLNIRGARVTRCGTTRERSFILDWPTGHGPRTVVKGLEIDYDIVGE